MKEKFKFGVPETRDNSTVEAEQFAKFITVNGVNYLLFSTVFVRKGLGRILPGPDDGCPPQYG